MKSHALLVAMLLQASVSSASLPFVRDDYARARAEAKQRKLPMFVDVWAPW
jgi:hypothetical protein